MAAQRSGFIGFLANIRIPLSALARFAVGGMFIYLAIMKLIDPIEFLKQVREYGFMPEDFPLFLNLTAVVVPWIELVCGLALILGVFVRGAAATILAMLLFFTPLLLMRAFDLYESGSYAGFCDVRFDCGCGTGEVYICSKMLENNLLKLGALIALLVGQDRWSLSRLFVRRRATQTEGALAGAE